MNSYSEVFIIVEGRTEQTFIENILKPEFSYKGVMLHPCQIGNPGHKGGNINIDRFLNDFEKFLKQRNDTYISTMFDYYGIDSNWPGYFSKEENERNLKAIDKYKKIIKKTKQYLFNKFPDYKDQIKNRFIPYFSMHEFESLLFTKPEILADKINISVNSIKSIVDNFDTIEDINDSPNNSPSKRIERLDFNYKKVINGFDIAKTIGLESIREKSKIFDNWLFKLESLN